MGGDGVQIPLYLKDGKLRVQTVSWAHYDVDSGDMLKTGENDAILSLALSTPRRSRSTRSRRKFVRRLSESAALSDVRASCTVIRMRAGRSHAARAVAAVEMLQGRTQACKIPSPPCASALSTEGPADKKIGAARGHSRL